MAAVLRFLLADQARRLEAAHHRHLDIHQDQIERFGQGGELLLAVAGDLHPVPLRSSNITASRWLIRLSSTSGMKASARRRRCRRLAASAATSPTPRRRVKWKVLPVLPVLTTQIRPSIIATSFWQIASPSPVPGQRPRDRSVRLREASKIPGCLDAGMPMPVSRTRDMEVDAGLAFYSAAASTTPTGDAALFGEFERIADGVDQELAQALDRLSGPAVPMDRQNGRD